MKGMKIETPIDELVKLLQERKKLSINKAASILGVETSKVEEWVKILEENGFVELIYPALGKPQIILKDLKGK